MIKQIKHIFENSYSACVVQHIHSLGDREAVLRMLLLHGGTGRNSHAEDLHKMQYANHLSG
jgi:hypothetical protein